jgi:Fe-S cluster assembly protein SufD
MSTLLDSLTLDPTGDAQRRVVLDAIVRDGLPGPRSEAWKYTPLRALERRSFARAGTEDAGIDAALPGNALEGIPAPRMVFVNGRHAPAHSDLSALPAGVTLSSGAQAPAASGAIDARPDDVFARLGSVLAADGVMLRVDAGAQVEPAVHLVFVGAPARADQAWHLAHHVEVGAGARVTLVEHQLAAAPHAHFSNALMRIELQAGAVLSHLRVQGDASAATSMLRTDVLVAEGAEYRRLDLELGAALSRHELNVRLAGDGARLVANGVLPADGRRHLDTRLGIEHLARDTSCDLLWRGVADGRGRAVFHGSITIHPGADGSDANLSNKNLLLSDAAEIDSQPVLVIHADEVKAAHGATVGQLDPTAMFYLRSRGLPEADARRLLTAAFVREPLSVVASPELRASLEARMDKALRALAPE